MFYGTVCNASCPYCYNHVERTDRRQVRMTREQLMFAAETLRLFPEPLDVLMYCGGEPTVMADDLIAQMNVLPKSRSLKLYTNGFLVPELRRIVTAAVAATGTLELRISVHDGIYADRQVLDEHLAAWAEFHDVASVRYVAVLDGARTADYIDMLNHLVDVVGGDMVNGIHVRRGAKDVSMASLARATSVVKRLGNTGLQEALKRSSTRDTGVNPNIHHECAGNRHVIIFDDQNIRGVLCSPLRIPYDDPHDVVEKIMNAPPLQCTSRFYFCECSVNW